MGSVENIQGQDKPNIQLVEKKQDLSSSALDIFISAYNKALEETGTFKAAISGGHTPEGFFELLGSSSKARDIDWSKVHLFWVDERLVPPDSEASNYGLAAHTFLDKVPIPFNNVHRVSGESDNYAEAVVEYEKTIRKVFALSPGKIPEFDLIVLGMGTDGHIGSLFPNSYALFDTDDLVSTVYFMDGSYNRITLTHPVLCAAKHLLILISGMEKAEIVRDVLLNEPDEVKYPVHTLWPILSKVTWLIEKEAGKYLTE